MSRDFEVRAATLEDRDELLAMHMELAEYCEFDMSRFGITAELVRSTLDEGVNSRYFVAENINDDELIGMMLCHRIPFGWGGVPGVYVEDLYTRSEHRQGRGVGRMLLASAGALALDYARPFESAAFLRLDTHTHNNDPTINFYRRMGMSEENTNFRLDERGIRSVIASAQI